MHVKSYNELNVAHLNIRSLIPKLDEVSVLVNKHNIDILCLNETWLDHNTPTDSISIPGYCLHRTDRNRHGGGTAIYVRSNIKHEPVTDIETQIPVESCWISLKGKSNAIIGTIYRPPNTDNNYLENIKDTIDIVINKCDNTIITGDFNIDYKFNEDLHKNPIYIIQIY